MSQRNIPELLSFFPDGIISEIVWQGNDLYFEIQLPAAFQKLYASKLIKTRLSGCTEFKLTGFESQVNLNFSDSIPAFQILWFFEGETGSYLACQFLQPQNQTLLKLSVSGEKITFTNDKNAIIPEAEIEAAFFNWFYQHPGAADRSSNKEKQNFLIKQFVTPILKKFSFHKKRSQFRRAETALFKILEIVNSRWNNPLYLDFSFAVYIFTNHQPMAKNATMDDFFTLEAMLLHKEIRELVAGSGIYYQIDQATNTFQLGRQLTNDLLGRILPFMLQFVTVDSVIAYLEKENEKRQINFHSLNIAMALVRLGRKEESKKYFREALGEKEYIEKMARHFGVEL